MKKVEGIIDIRDMLKPFTDEEKVKHKVQQLDLFKDYKPPLPFWKRVLNKLLRRN